MSTSISYAKYARAELDVLIQKIEAAMTNYFDTDFGVEGIPYHPSVAYAVEVFKDVAMRPAKRLRGSFVLKSYEMFAGEPHDEVMKAAVAIEVLHAYLLIIDDFNDKSELRRGRLTAHRLFEEQHRKNLIGDSEHYGNSVATVAGLFGAHHAMELVLKINLDPEKVIRASSAVNHAINITAYGQIRDIYNQNLANPTEEDVMRVHAYKTAHYTYFNPIQMGMILAGAADADIIRMKGYTEPAGIAFQVQDDILGVFGKPEKTGKSNTDDIKEGKTTLLTIKAFEKASPAQRQVLARALGNRELDSNLELFNDVQQIIIDTGSLEYSKRVAYDLVVKAKESIYREFADKSDNEGFKFIAGIADYMIERDL